MAKSRAVDSHASPTDPAPSAGESSRRFWTRDRVAVFTLFTAAYFMSYFYRSANAVIAPDLAREMNLGAAQLGLMTSLFYGVFAAIQLPMGVALDRWGPRWVTPFLLLIGVAGSLIFAAAPTFGWLAVGRAMLGLGMAGCLMGSLKILSQWFPAARFATVSGALVGIGALGALAAATPMAWVNSLVGWRVIFVGGAVVTGLIAAAIMVGTRNAPPGVVWREQGPSGGALRDVFAEARFWRIAPLSFFLAGAVLSFQGLWAGPYLYDGLGLDEIAVGNLLLLLGIGVTAGYGLSGWIADRFGLGRVLRVVAIFFGLSQLTLAIIPPLGMIAPLYLLFGFTGGFNVMVLAHVRRIFPLPMMGKASSALNLFAIGGTFLVQWWMGLIIESFAPVAPGQYPPAAYSAALLFTGIGSLLACAWYWPFAGRQEN
jgi:predicted MFS family arabinose efflux permease